MGEGRREGRAKDLWIFEGDRGSRWGEEMGGGGVDAFWRRCLTRKGLDAGKADPRQRITAEESHIGRFDQKISTQRSTYGSSFTSLGLPQRILSPPRCGGARSMPSPE